MLVKCISSTFFLISLFQGRQIEYIDIERPSAGGLGFSVVALRSQNLGEVDIFVKEVQPGSIADR